MSSSIHVKLNPTILPHIPHHSHRADWKQELSSAFRDVDALLEALSIRPDQAPDLDPGPAELGLLVPRGYAALMTPGDAQDPLLRQVLPLRAEGVPRAGFVRDPVGDGAATRGPGVLHKYAGRLLVVATSACAIHCRYCFRRHYPYGELAPARERFDRLLALVGDDPSIHEVILSGGDPLMLDDAPLAALLDRLRRVPHLKRIRIHSRLPVVLPARVTPELIKALTQGGLRTIVVIHANHPRELGSSAETALSRLAAAGVQLFNQSVLLRGVNDDVDTLAELSERLLDCRAAPYYLHQLDPVEGAAHFGVDDERARRLVDTLRGRLSGYLVPRLVREIPGEVSKTRIA